MVLNATIDRYAYAFINRRDDGLVSYRARGPNIEKDQGLDNLEGVSSLPLHQAVYQAVDHRPERRRSHTNDHHHLVDSPPGAGLGSSSALVVALIEAFCCFFQKSLGPYEIARLAFEIERIDLG